MKARLSAGWSHDPAHYRFARTSPRAHHHIPFADERGPSRSDVVGALLLVALVALLATAPWWMGLIHLMH